LVGLRAAGTDRTQKVRIMETVSEKVEQGVVEQRFDLRVDDDTVPGIRWSPEGATGPRPTILIGHGGTQHKRVPNVLGLARRFVRHLGYSAVALDAPGHGERVTDPEKAARRRQAIQDRIAAGPGAGGPADLGPEEAREWVERTIRGMAEWRALLDCLDAPGDAPRYGYWGVSMGTAIGLPFVASEPRVQAAVLGLAGLGNRPGADRFEEAARGLTIPVLLVLQWNDELVGQTSGLALFDAIGSSEKTLHVNPGGHVQIPLFERDAYEAFFLRHLGPAIS
jgi:dienelactone hydrolase